MLWGFPDEGTGGILVSLDFEGISLVSLDFEGISLITAALQQCSLPSKDWGNSSSFIALFSQPVCLLPVLGHPSALLALGTLPSQLVLKLGWISHFSGVPMHPTQKFQLHIPDLTTLG